MKKPLATVVIAAVIFWASWLFRYDVQLIPMLQPEDATFQNAGQFIDKEGFLLVLDPTNPAVANRVKGPDGADLKPRNPIAPITIWKWDRWTHTGRIEAVAGLDSFGNVVTKDALAR